MLAQFLGVHQNDSFETEENKRPSVTINSDDFHFLEFPFCCISFNGSKFFEKMICAWEIFLGDSGEILEQVSRHCM